MFAARPATGSQSIRVGVSGAGRGAGGLPVVTHEQHGWNADAAVGTCRDSVSADATSPGLQDGSAETRPIRSGGSFLCDLDQNMRREAEESSNRFGSAAA